MSSGIVWLVAPWLVGGWSFGASAGGWRGGIGVIGDSYSDEYAFYPPHCTAARNWVEILAELRGLDFGPYSTASRGEPRNQGYAYNWARSAATTDDMIAQGQHTGLAEQVARGEVQVACIFIGGNDFIAGMSAPDPPSALAAAVDRAAENLALAVRTILEASEVVRVVPATVPDITELPEFTEPLAAGQLPAAWIDAASAAVRAYNARVRALAKGAARVAVADLDRYNRIARLLSPRYLVVGGRRLARGGVGAGIDHVFLADRRHAGTLVHGLIARVMIATLNRHFGTMIPPVTDRELIDYATRIARGEPTLAGDLQPVDAVPCALPAGR